MPIARRRIAATLTATLALALAGCGGDDTGSSVSIIAQPAPTPVPAPVPTPTPTPPPTAVSPACSLRAQQDFADRTLNEWYLFPDLLAPVNPASFSNLDDYLDARVAPARAQRRDRFFTFATSIADEDALTTRGATGGFGMRLSYDTAARRVFVMEAFENSNALAAGLDRGAEITAIGVTAATLEPVASLFARGGTNAVIDALGPSTAGLTRVLRFIPPGGGAVIEREVPKSNFSLDPISDRYGVVRFVNGPRQVGYINLRTFGIEDGARQLREAFGQFRAQGVVDLILDFRYNGGGLVNVADTLGDLMGADRIGQVWSRTVLRPSKASDNETRNFQSESNAIAPRRVAVIVTGSSASASELVTNSLIPYLGNDLALIGSNSFGKPVGQFGFDLEECDLRLRAVTFKTVNAAGQGDYFDGLARVVPNTCRATDDLSRPLGDPREASIATALNFMTGATCTPIAGGGGATQGGTMAPNSAGLLLGGAGGRVMLQPDRPSAAQREIVGLF